MRRLAAVVLACLPVSLVACGGGGEQLDARGYQREVNRIVLTAQEQFPADLDPSANELPELAEAMERASDAFGQARDDVDDLRPPDDLEAEDGELRDALGDMAATLSAAARSARDGDEAAVVRAVGPLADALERLTRVNLQITQAAARS